MAMKVIFPLEITTPKKRYPAAEACIYCGASKDLEEEHIVPFGLTGDMVILPNGSCRKCASITGHFEGSCLGSMLGNFRIAVGSPTRRPKARRKRKTIKFRAGDLSQDGAKIENIQTITIPRSDYPLIYPSLQFPGAGLLEGRDPRTPVDVTVNVHRLENQLETFSKAHGSVELEPLFILETIRMIAKITHGYAAAELGIDGFRPYLLDLILGRIETISEGLYWIGCEPVTPPPTGDLISLSQNKIIWRNGTKLVVAKLRLFSFFTTPVYHVVVGEWGDA